MYERTSGYKNPHRHRQGPGGDAPPCFHPCGGVVITRLPVDTYVPLAKNDETVVTQFTMTTLEELGLLKMDFLGLRNLTVLDDARKMMVAAGSRTLTRPGFLMTTRRPSEMIAGARPPACFRWNPAA